MAPRPWLQQRALEALLSLLVWVCADYALGQQPANPRQHEFTDQIQPLLRKYCYECHSQTDPQGDVILTRYQTPQQIVEGRKVWLNAVTKIRAGEMPPDEAQSKPTSAERARIADWVTTVLASVDCNGVPEPGRVTLRRLTRYEYRNSIRDLTGIDYTPAQDFPADDTGYGFDNIGDVLSLPPLLFEKYVAAAEQIAHKAIVIVEPNLTLNKRMSAAGMKAAAGRIDNADVGSRALLTNATLSQSFDAPRAGEYDFRILAGGDQAGGEPVKMGLTIDGKQEKVFLVKNPRKDLKVYAIKHRLTKGSHTLAVEFLNDYYNAEEKDAKKRDRNLIVNYVHVEGPLNVAEKKLPESHDKIIFAVPDAKTTRREASEKVLKRFASWAFRRPATPAEVSRLVALTEQSRLDGETYEQGIQLAIQAVLVSPHFIYKVEMDPPGREGKPRPLNEFEVATRLSYYLWSSGPDAELLFDCTKNRLFTGTVLEDHVRRMLKDHRSKALIENFVSQWLELRSLDQRRPDAALFPSFDAELEFAMRRETEIYVWTILRDDRSIIELLSSDFTFVNESLARLYGIPGVVGDQFQRVPTKGNHRGGILTQASFLTVTSNPNRTSPVKRGRFILDNILGTPLPPPPPNVPELNTSPLKGTLRQRMEQHRVNPSCASCHDRMDPLGFALENFDGIGKWRENEGRAKIDASGKLPSGEEFSGPEDLRKLLVARKDQFVECLTEKMLTYALGRGLEYYDQCAVDKIVKNVKAADYRFSSLVLEIVRSEPFLKKGSKGSTP